MHTGLAALALYPALAQVVPTLEALGWRAVAVGSTPAEFAKFIAAEQQRWKVVIARAKIKPD